jgi:septal ring factor EnvC (AmiA/AmiB activator)
MTEDIAEAEVAEIEPKPVDGPRPKTDMEVFSEAKSAKRTYAEASANTRRLREELASALIAEAQAQEAASKAKRSLDKVLEPEP